MRQEWCRILRPEHDDVHIFRSQGNTADLVGIERIRHIDEPGAEPCEEPRAVKGGNVRPPADAENNGELLLSGA